MKQFVTGVVINASDISTRCINEISKTLWTTDQNTNYNHHTLEQFVRIASTQTRSPRKIIPAITMSLSETKVLPTPHSKRTSIYKDEITLHQINIICHIQLIIL